MITTTKIYTDLPASHRQPNHAGHCRLIHGHNWSFHITFGSDTLDDNGFVIDVGELGVLKTFLQEHFDHTLLLNESDPFLKHFKSFLTLDGPNSFGEATAKIVVVPNCGMEGLAKYVFENTNALLSRHFPDDVGNRGLQVLKVTCWEDSKNSSTYYDILEHE